MCYLGNCSKNKQNVMMHNVVGETAENLMSQHESLRFPALGCYSKYFSSERILQNRISCSEDWNDLKLKISFVKRD